jgi:phytoene dehydrogenase-like protein
VEGLYLVGADAGARGVGTEMAAGSALALADLLA